MSKSKSDASGSHRQKSAKQRDNRKAQHLKSSRSFSGQFNAQRQAGWRNNKQARPILPLTHASACVLAIYCSAQLSRRNPDMTAAGAENGRSARSSSFGTSFADIVETGANWSGTMFSWKASTVAGILCTLSLSICSSNAETLKARLAQNLSPISGLTIVAKQEGFFTKEDLDITVSNFTSGKQCLDTVIGGGADIATTAEAPTTAAAMAGLPIAFLARMEYSDDKTVASSKSGIKTKADLRGKKIAFTAGTGSEVYTAALLKSAGLTQNDVTLINLQPQDMLPALASGSIDAFDSWEPHISNAKKALGSGAVSIDTKGIYSETFNIVVTKDYLKNNEVLLQKFLRALIEAEAWTKAHPKEAIDVVAKATGIKPDDLAAIWSDYVYHVALDDKQIDVLKAHAAWRLESGNHPPGVSSMPDLSKVIEPGPLKNVDASRVTYTMK